MSETHMFCSHCGAKHNHVDWPKKCFSCGQTSYLNPLPVVVALVRLDNGLVVIRRNTEPQKGTLTFPGGYIDAGETWQNAAKRELFEETGILLDDGEFALYDGRNGLDNTLVVFGITSKQPRDLLKPFSSKETQEVLIIEQIIELGFPNHTEVLKELFG